MKILVVEDDRKVAMFIARGLREEGYAVDVARDGEEATTLAKVYDYDTIILDLMLPRKDGYQVTADLRADRLDTPILMLTARDAPEDLIRGLDTGADDYLIKPFRFDELLARIRALLRRSRSRRIPMLTFGPLHMDRIKHVAAIGERPLDLTPREFQLLEQLMLQPGTVVPRGELLRKVWETHSDPASRVVDACVASVRKKLRAAGQTDLIETVRGTGFRLRLPGTMSEATGS